MRNPLESLKKLTEAKETPKTNNDNIVKKRKQYGNVVIYALLDPDTHKVFYVGRSKHPEARLLQHLSEAEQVKTKEQHPLERLFGIIIEGKESREKGKYNEKKVKKINDILERGKDPKFVILDQWYAPTLRDANRLEDAWIAEMRRRGEPLTNMILSRRMEVWWYDSSRDNFNSNWAKSPMEFIQLLKSGKFVSHHPVSRRAYKPNSRRIKRRYFPPAKNKNSDLLKKKAVKRKKQKLK